VASFGRPLLLDWSAYTRVLVARRRGPGGGRLTADQLALFDTAVLDDELYVCPPFRLEARYSARSAGDFRALSLELDGFRQAPADGSTWELAETAQQALADDRAVSHRVKLVDLLVAAIAHQHGLGVLHYDRDYETIADSSGLAVEHVWIAPRGTVD